MAWNDVLPPRGSAATDYPTIRRAVHPTAEDLAWADAVAMVDPRAAKRVAGDDLMPMLFPDDSIVLTRMRRKARRAGVTPFAVLVATLGMLDSHGTLPLPGEGMNTLLVGPADLSRKVLLIAAEEVKATIDLWMNRHTEPKGGDQ